ncbi:hypothetical protein HDV00_005586 [Rhizophlyctis rosea]|nr:hypothetical protein HDV00_005586 [Rhizophlyctis rosea]
MRLWEGWGEDGPGEIEEVMLDTTYCNPRFKFPHQDIITTAVGELIAQRCREYTPPNPTSTDPALSARCKTLVLIATYTIGKEKVLKEVSRSLDDIPIIVTPEKKAILEQLELSFMDIFTTDIRASNIWVVSWGKLGEMAPGGWRFLPNWSFCEQFLEWRNSSISDPSDVYTRLIGVVPTGWTHEFQKRYGTGALYHEQIRPNQPPDSPEFRIYEVPYSEHSNFEELRSFIDFLKPARVTPTVVPKGTNPVKLANFFRDLVDSKRSHEKGVLGLFGGLQSTSSNISEDSPRKLEDGDCSPPPAENLATNASDDTLLSAKTPPPIEETPIAEQPVSCPICSLPIPPSEINIHLDVCLTASQSAPEPPDTSTAVKPKEGGPSPATKAPQAQKRHAPDDSPGAKSAASKRQTTLSAWFAKK